MSTTEGNTNSAQLREQLQRCEQLLEQLRTEYEQYFLGIVKFAPEKLHKKMKAEIRRIRSQPFRNSQANYHLRTIEQRYQTYNNYWTRVIRQKEEGTYFRDVFKAELREKIAREDAEQKSERGQVRTGVKALFDTYQHALEKQAGKSVKLDYKKFEKKLLHQAEAFRKQNGNAKLSFKVVMKNGKVTLQAKAKDSK